MKFKNLNWLFALAFVFIFSGSVQAAVTDVMLPQAEKAEYVGMETCAACHEDQVKQFEFSSHARITVKDDEVEAEGCEMCHGPGSIHAEAGGGRGTMINPRSNPDVCFKCHMEKKMEFRLPFRHPVLEGKMSCADCHELHGPEAKPWSTTSLEGVNEACMKCHQDKRGPFAWEHEALRDGCQVCHNVHGSITDKMLVARDANLCLRCHVQVDHPVIGNSHSTSRLLQSTCWGSGCHTAVHGSSYNRHLRD